MKKKLQHSICLSLIAFLLVATGFNPINAQKKSATDGDYKYEYVENDAWKTRIYTLPNGLKVYLSPNNVEPRIQTLIGVKVGCKNDPRDNTGLAHYLEHMLFKGTDKYGSLDYTKEEPMLQKIEDLYEEYRQIDMDILRIQCS